MGIDDVVSKVKKNRDKKPYAVLYDFAQFIRRVEVPIPKIMAAFLYQERIARHGCWYWLINKFYYEPLLRYRCTTVGKNVRCDGDIPLIEGIGDVIIGDNVFVGNSGAWFFGSNLPQKPRLVVGDNTTINYRTVISIESSIRIGRNCLIAEECKIFDNNSHGIDYRKRDMTDADVAEIVIEDNVWIGMNSIVLKGVRIGMGAVVAAGSVVTKSVPSMTVVGGVPARILKKIT